MPPSPPTSPSSKRPPLTRRSSTGSFLSRAALLALLLTTAPAAAQRVSGFLQTDAVVGQESEDQLDNGTGQLLNRNRFFIRRGRFKVSDDAAYFGYAAELDLNSVNGPQVAPRQVEAAAHWPRVDQGPPLVEGGGGDDGEVQDEPQPDPNATIDATAGLRFRFGAGIFRAPFGHEVYEMSGAGRLFAEPALMSVAFFPTDGLDVGARATARYKNLELTLGVQNGEPLGTNGFPLRDPNAAKDVFARFVASGQPFSWLKLEGGTSAMWGKGFSPGTPPTKDVLIWRDLNEDSLVQLSELQALRGAAGIFSQNFDRWGVGADGRARFTTPIGTLNVLVEGAIATNLDRGIRPANPVLTGQAQRAVSGYAAVVQEIGRYGLVGVRADYYQPQLDAAELQNGVLVRSVEIFNSYSFAAAARFRADKLGGRVLVDYTLRRDPLGRNSAGQVSDLANDVLTFRVQVEY